MLAEAAPRFGDVGLVPKQVLGEADRHCAVGHAVVEPPDESDAALPERVHEVDRPKRTRAIESFFHHAGADAPQVVLRDRARHRKCAHVILDVEGGVLDPDCPVPRAHLQPSSQLRRASDSRRDTRAERLGIRPGAVPRRVEDRDFQSVAGDRLRLQSQDR
jgi:hypothetical protein